MQTYSDFFKTLHDEQKPTGYLGRGAHYSVLRAVVFHDPLGKPLPQGQFADFAVIWDEDHDVRVMEPIEEIYWRGLLSSFIMFGEHKGCFTAILSNKSSSAIEAIPFKPAFFTKVDDLDLSIRTANCCKNDYIVFIGDLIQKSEAEMLRTPNFGRKSLNEIKEVLTQMGLHLGMELPGWPPGNLDELAELVRLHKSSLTEIDRLATEINTICQSLNDQWTSKVVSVESASNPIIDDESEKVSLYLKNLEMLWRLGNVHQKKRMTMKELAELRKQQKTVTNPTTPLKTDAPRPFRIPGFSPQPQGAS
jgi:Bacterial RNA polymerase, alpha chain C terminal domain